MGEVENFAAEHVSPSIGERLIRVVDALQDRKVPIEEVLLFDPMEAFPKRWQDLLKLLPIEIVGNVETGPADQPFLGELQAALRVAQSGELPPKLHWRSDGSVIVVQARVDFWRELAC